MHTKLGLIAAALVAGTSSVAIAQDRTETTTQTNAGDAGATTTTTTTTTTSGDTTVTTGAAYDANAGYDASADTGERRVPQRAPKNAFELGVEGGYTQPFGKIDKNRNMVDVADAGGAAGLTAAYRFNPHWSLGVTGQYHENAPDENLGEGAKVRGVAAGVVGTYHMMPYGMVDPYASLGTGYRAMWIVPNGATPNDMVHGFELGKAELGVDFRVSKSVAIGPVVGADVNMFVWDNPQGTGNQSEIDTKKPSTFVFAGAAARFDIGGKRVPENRPIARAQAPVPAAAPAEPRPIQPPPEPTGIAVEENIMQQCDINGPKAFFQFDSAELQSNDLSTLDAVANCFATGPMKGRRLYIIGHADPRGTDQYNMVLGESRAQSVERYLSDHGVETTNIVTISRGERESSGKDENGYAFDRRVDLRLQSE